MPKNRPPDEFLPDLWWTQAEMREAFMIDCGADPFDAYAQRVIAEAKSDTRQDSH